MPSFDIVSEVNKVEVKNAVEQCNKEVSNRAISKRVSIASRSSKTLKGVSSHPTLNRVRTNWSSSIQITRQS